MHRAKKRIAWAVVALSTLAILVATLRSPGGALPPGWSFSITSGDAALAELIQNLLLFLPLGVSLTLAGVRPRRAIALGALLSFAVEFAQQWIPGRDPSTGDILCNSISTALGVALVRFAPRWLTTTPRRSAWQALATAVVAPAFDYWAQYEGAVLWSNFALGPLSVRAVAPAHPPDRESPLVAVLDARAVEVFILSMDGHDLALRYRMPAIHWKLETPDLRWRGAFAAIAPGDTFTAVATYHGKQICLWLNDAKRCGFGYTIGDGWKLIFYPGRWPGGVLTAINVLWVVGCVVGVGFWAASGGGGRR